MKGTLVIGLVHGAGEGAVAAAVGAVLRRSGEQVRVERPEEREPQALLRGLRDGEGTLIAALPGGLLGALTPRVSVRDVAHELGLRVVLSMPAGADAVNVVRLSVAAARAGHLHIAAVVLTGWEDPPEREHLDARRVLAETVGLPVLELPASPGARADVVRDWPVEKWIEPPPEPAPEPVRAPAPRAAAPAPAAPRTGDLGLEPYVAWTERPVGDPRSTPRPRIMEAMLEIIAAEGPLQAARAYALYNRASGGKKLTTTARAPLASAVNWLSQQRDIAKDGDEVVRMPDQPEVRLRELGPRTLEEVPLDEIAELMRRLGTRDEAALKRGVLQAYGLVRLTTRADEYLARALERI